MAIAWALRKPQVTSALIGASSVQQLEDNVAALNHPELGEGELREIEAVLAS
jgi:L-glyceraldehyde 3-phosphate reductase